MNKLVFLGSRMDDVKKKPPIFYGGEELNFLALRVREFGLDLNLFCGGCLAVEVCDWHRCWLGRHVERWIECQLVMLQLVMCAVCQEQYV